MFSIVEKHKRSEQIEQETGKRERFGAKFVFSEFVSFISFIVQTPFSYEELFALEHCELIQSFHLQ